MRMHGILAKINSGKGAANDIALAERLGQVMTRACLCGLGQAAPGPVLTTLKNFRADYNAKLV